MKKPMRRREAIAWACRTRAHHPFASGMADTIYYGIQAPQRKAVSARTSNRSTSLGQPAAHGPWIATAERLENQAGIANAWG
jgi:hypothetical protein